MGLKCDFKDWNDFFHATLAASTLDEAMMTSAPQSRNGKNRTRTCSNFCRPVALVSEEAKSGSFFASTQESVMVTSSYRNCDCSIRIENSHEDLTDLVLDNDSSIMINKSNMPIAMTKVSTMITTTTIMRSEIDR